MDFNPGDLDLAIARTREEIDRLTHGLATLEEARRFLRDHPSLLPSPDGTRKRVRTEQPVGRFELKSEESNPVREGDLAGKTLLDAADVLLGENHNEPLSSQEIASHAISRGYRSTHPKNKDNDPAKIARSLRLMMERHPDRYENEGGKFRIKQEDV
jgi:hypothetical protein